MLVGALADVGLGRLVGSQRAYLNVNREFLLAFRPLPLPADRVVLELVEDQVVDDELLGVLGELVEEGFTLALDNFEYRPELEPLLRLASVAKVDVQALDRARRAHRAPLGYVLSDTRGQSHELLVTALVRAALCERRAGRDLNAEADRAFTVGLFSVADALLETTMPELLAELPFDERTTEALLDHVGPEGRILRTVLAYERWPLRRPRRQRAQRHVLRRRRVGHRDGRPAGLSARRAHA
ncbi:MAG: hypothetical protein ACXW08_01885 [Solirubrobacteraceae bacterium]